MARVTQNTAPVNPTEIVTVVGDNIPIHIRVHITRDISLGRPWRIETNRPDIQPTRCSQLVGHLPPALTDSIRQAGLLSYRITEVLGNGSYGQLEQWQEAIANQMLAAIRSENLEPIEVTAFNSPAYMAVGGMLYKLQPLESKSTTRALTTMRRRIRAKLEEWEKAEMAKASANAAAIIANTVAKQKEVDAQLAELQRGVGTPPPNWAVRNHCILMQAENGLWYVNMKLEVEVLRAEFEYAYVDPADPRKVIYKRKIWKCARPPVVTTRVWQPINNTVTGEYIVTACYIEDIGSQLPHLSHDHGCVGLADAPPHLRTFDHFKSLKASLTRAMSVINLKSLLIGFNAWAEPIKKAFSPAFKDAVTNEYVERALKELPADEEIVINQAQEHSETWIAA
jgi:hypothetical protein